MTPEAAHAVSPTSDAPVQFGRRPELLTAVRLARTACAVGVVFAAVSAYWAMGGTWLVATIGGSLERQARAGGARVVVVLLTVAVVKLVAAVLPLLALRRLTHSARDRYAWALAWAEAAVLTVYGVAYTGVGLLVQTGVIDVAVTANRRALAWHAYLWDPWFLIWGLLVAAALLRGRHDRKPTLEHGRT